MSMPIGARKFRCTVCGKTCYHRPLAVGPCPSCGVRPGLMHRVSRKVGGRKK